MVPVAAHADGVQPVPHGEAPAAAPAPAEVKATPGKGGGWAPEAQGPLVSGLPGPLPFSRTLAIATLSLHPGSAVGSGFEGLDQAWKEWANEGPSRTGVKAQDQPGPGVRAGLSQVGIESGQCRKGSWLGRSWGGHQAPADSGRGPETLRVADQRIKDADNLGKSRPLSPVLVPTVKHELVQGAGTAHRCWQAVPLLHGADDLEWGSTALGWRRPCPPRPHTASSQPGSHTHVPVGHVPVGPLPVG